MKLYHGSYMHIQYDETNAGNALSIQKFDAAGTEWLRYLTYHSHELIAG